MDNIRIIIVDDHKILRVGLRSMLESKNNIEVVHEAKGIANLFEVIDDSIDVILMDIDLHDGSGIEATKRVKKDFPDIHVLGISMHNDSKYITDMIKAGAEGYIMKDVSDDELEEAIRSVSNGKTYYDRQVSFALMDAMLNETKTKSSSTDEILSKREVEVLKLIAQELSNSEIAEKLFISIRTVDTHRRNLLEKLNAKNTAGLVKYAIAKGYV